MMIRKGELHGYFVIVATLILSNIAIYLNLDSLISGDQDFFKEHVNSDVEYNGHFRYILWVGILKLVGLQYFLYFQSVLLSIANFLNYKLIKGYTNKNSILLMVLITFEPMLLVFSSSIMRDVFLYSLVSIIIYIYFIDNKSVFLKMIIALLLLLAGFMRIQLGVVFIASIFIYKFRKYLVFNGKFFLSVFIALIVLFFLTIFLNSNPPDYITHNYLTGGSSNIIQYVTKANNVDESGGILGLGYIDNLSMVGDYAKLVIIQITNPFLAWSLPFPNRFTSLAHFGYLFWGLIYLYTFINTMFIKLKSNKMIFLRIYLFLFSILVFSSFSNIGGIFRTRLSILPIIFIFFGVILLAIKKNEKKSERHN
jgi:hypothetical protein